MSERCECTGGENPYVEGGTAAKPAHVSTPSQLPPTGAGEGRKALPEFPRGQEIKFAVPEMRDGYKYKVTVGYLEEDTDPILEDWVRPPDGETGAEEVVVLTSDHTLELRAGTYAYDIWEIPCDGEESPKMIRCGGFKLFRTVGGRTLRDDEVFNGEFDAQDPGD